MRRVRTAARYARTPSPDATDPRPKPGAIVATPDVETLGLVVLERLHELLDRLDQLLEQLLVRHPLEVLSRHCHGLAHASFSRILARMSRSNFAALSRFFATSSSSSRCSSVGIHVVSVVMTPPPWHPLPWPMWPISETRDRRS